MQQRSFFDDDFEADMAVKREAKSVPFVKGSDTSKAAAESIGGVVDRDRILILSFIKRVDGATCDEIEVALGLSHQTASARCSDLKNKFCLIVDSGERRKTRSGRNASVYVARKEKE